MKLNKAISEAKKIASQSNMKFKMGAILFDNSKFVTGFNRKFSVTHPTRWKSFSIHAEEMAILRASRVNIDFSNSTLVVVRINKNNELKRSYPCEQCQNLIQKFGVRNTYFSA